MNELLDKMAEILETPVTAETEFRSIPDWSSLMGFSILVMLENDYSRQMTVDEFMTMNTVADLARAAGIA